MKNKYSIIPLALLTLVLCRQTGNAAPNWVIPKAVADTTLKDPANNGEKDGPGHVKTTDLSLVDSAFVDGYTKNIVYGAYDGKSYAALRTQSTTHKKSSLPKGAMVWTRDLYWGDLGWAQAGDDNVLAMMRSQIQMLLIAKSKNQAMGQSARWPLNNGRFYIPQTILPAFADKGIVASLNYFPWDSESQADFLLLTYNYWKLTGDNAFIASIWNEIEYITQTIELLDTDGNSLPDAIWGSYDYQNITRDMEEPLMCAKAGKAYWDVSELAKAMGKTEYANRLAALSSKVKAAINKSTDDGGLRLPDSKGGYFITRTITKGAEKMNETFIPYDNLVPMWLGMTTSHADDEIFAKLDSDYKLYYDGVYGPMYCAPAVWKDGLSVMNYSTVTWLGFLDVYLRGKKGHLQNRNQIFDSLMKQAYVAGGVPFSEGAGIYGDLTGNAGRSWDNGNFFHMLVSGIYGIEKSKEGVTIVAPQKIDGTPLTALNNVCWRKSVYNIKWTGGGNKIKTVLVDGKKITANSGAYLLTNNSGKHKVEVVLF